MKKFFTIFCLALGFYAQSQVKIGSLGAPDANAVLELDGGTSKGFLLPRITTTDMNGTGFSSAPNGLMIYNATDGFIYIRKASAWQKITDATNNGTFTLPYAGTASTVGGAEFSITHTTTFGDAASFSNTAGAAGLAVGTLSGNNKFNMTSGNTGIGIPAGLSESPSLARLVVRGVVGNTSAVFGDKTSGVSIENTPPGIAFNAYTNSGSKNIIDGYSARIYHNPANGFMYFNTSSVAGTTGNVNDASMVTRLAISNDGNVGVGIAAPLMNLHVKGTDSALVLIENSQALAAGVKSSIYLRTGSSYTGAIKTIGTSGVDARLGLFTYSSGAANQLKEQLSISDAGNVGIGNTSPLVPLSFSSALGKKISLYKGNTGDAGFGVFANELRINSDYNGADITFGYDDLTNGFTERVRMKANGNVGIGTNDPQYKLDVNGRMALRYNGASAGMWLNKQDNSAAAFVGNFNDSIYGVYNASNGWQFFFNHLNGNMGIGNSNPRVDLSFSATTGKKISLYPGGTGDVSMGVYGNEFRLNTDYSGADITFGYDSYASGFTERMRIKGTGQVCIGTNTPASGYMLSINGKVIAEEVRVQLKTAWPDYVFSKNYNLRSLNEVEKYISENNHLPNVPAAADVDKSGIALGEMQTRMMEKIEELTLYVIELKKEIEALKKK